MFWLKPSSHSSRCIVVTYHITSLTSWMDAMGIFLLFIESTTVVDTKNSFTIFIINDKLVISLLHEGWILGPTEFDS
jgi:hypothetical protein